MLMEEIEPGIKVQCRGVTWTVKYKNTDTHTLCLHKPKPSKGYPSSVTVSLAEAKQEEPKKQKPPLVEWVDPGTGEIHTCPKAYVQRLHATLKVGKDNAQTATELLKLIGEDDNESNKRHLRQAALFLKQQGIQVISYRSSKGGYFVADTEEEVRTYTDEQRKLAYSMLTEAKKMDAITVSDSQLTFKNLSF